MSQSAEFDPMTIGSEKSLAQENLGLPLHGLSAHQMRSPVDISIFIAKTRSKSYFLWLKHSDA